MRLAGAGNNVRLSVWANSERRSGAGVQAPSVGLCPLKHALFRFCNRSIEPSDQSPGNLVAIDFVQAFVTCPPCAASPKIVQQLHGQIQ